MKKILLILVLCLSTIGLAGCGNKLPDKVELTPENNYTAIVGQDLREGKEYYIVVEDYNKEDVEKTKLPDDAGVINVRINNQNPPIEIIVKELLNNDKTYKKRINCVKNDKVEYNPHLITSLQTLQNVCGSDAKIFIVSE